MGNFGPVRRGAMSEFVHLDTWNNEYPGLE